MSVRSLTPNSPSALYFPFIPLWRNKSKFFFGRRCEESKAEHLLNTSSDYRPIWKGLLLSVHLQVQKENVFAPTDNYTTLTILMPEQRLLSICNSGKPQPSWEQQGVCRQETLRRVMCFASHHTLCHYKQHRERKHGSPTLSIQGW